MGYVDGAILSRAQSEAQLSGFERHREERGYGLWAAQEKASGALVGLVGLAHQGGWTEVG